MPTNMKRYDVLLSCPSDVYELSMQIKKAITDVNEIFKSDGFYFELRHWSNDVLIGFGTPQTIINEQIVKNSDAVIALFGSYLGTCTAKHESGTVEEIEIVAKMHRQVFVFFSKKVNATISAVELQRLNEYKKAFRTIGLYKEYDTEVDLYDNVKEQLRLYGEKLKGEPQKKKDIKESFVPDFKSSLVVSDNFDEDGLFKGFVQDLTKTPDETREEFLVGLENGEIDQKHVYMGKDATKTFLSKLNTKEYVIYKDTWQLLDSQLDDIVTSSLCDKKSLRIISLGIGNGQKDIDLIQETLKKTTDELEYIVIDISPDMIKKGIDTIKSVASVQGLKNRLDIRIACCDFAKIDKYFTNKHLPEKAKRRNIFLLLGNTLGNFDENKLLKSIKNAMNIGDLLLLDNQLKPNKITHAYKNKLIEIYSSNMEKENVHAVLKKGNIWPEYGNVKPIVENITDGSYLKPDDCVAIIQQFIFSDSRKITISDKIIPFDKGHRISVFFSRKYTHKALMRIINDEIQLEILKDYSNRNYALMLCEKKRL